jgi:hypothetical protein
LDDTQLTLEAEMKNETTVIKRNVGRAREIALSELDSWGVTKSAARAVLNAAHGLAMHGGEPAEWNVTPPAACVGYVLLRLSREIGIRLDSASEHTAVCVLGQILAE